MRSFPGGYISILDVVSYGDSSKKKKDPSFTTLEPENTPAKKENRFATNFQVPNLIFCGGALTKTPKNNGKNPW